MSTTASESNLRQQTRERMAAAGFQIEHFVQPQTYSAFFTGHVVDYDRFMTAVGMPAADWWALAFKNHTVGVKRYAASWDASLSPQLMLPPDVRNPFSKERDQLRYHAFLAACGSNEPQREHWSRITDFLRTALHDYANAALLDRYSSFI